MQIRDLRRKISSSSVRKLVDKCKRRGVNLSFASSEPKPAAPVKARAKDTTEVSTMEDLAKDSGMPLSLLRKVLPRELDKKSFRDGKIVTSDFIEWFEHNERVPVVEYLVSKGMERSVASNRAIQTSRFTFDKVSFNGRKRVFARKSDLDILFLESRGILTFTEDEKVAILDSLPDIIRPLSIQELDVRKLSSEDAFNILLECNSDNRLLSKERAKYIFRQIMAGYGIPGYVCFARYPDGRLVLKNGQHYLNALYNLKAEDVKTIVLTVDVADSRHALELFGQFDSPRSVRSENEQITAVYKEYAPPCSERNAVRFAKSMFAFFERTDLTKGTYRGYTGRMGYSDQKAYLLRAEAGKYGVVKFLERVFGSVSSRSMVKQPALVAAIWHYHIDPEAADEFWTPIVGTGGSFDRPTRAGVDPRAALRDFLQRASTSQHSATKSVPEKVMFSVVNRAWNRWRDGERVTRFHATDTPVIPH